MPISTAPIAAPSRPLAALPNWLKEPLLHFMILGGLLFGIDHLLAAREDDPLRIVIGAEVDAEARQLFTASAGRPPNADELKALRERWLDNEVLYREGLALGVDRGDTAIRERVIFKALSVVDASTKLPPVDDKVLRDWFEKNRVKYDEPARFDFQEAVLGGDRSEAAVRSFVEALKSGTPGDAKAGLRVFKGRPLANLLQSYGPEFAKSLTESPVGEWRAQPSRDGLLAVRLEAATPPAPASFEALRGVIQQDWVDATLAAQRTAAVRALTQKYRVIDAVAKP